MRPTQLDASAKDTLRKTIRTLRERLLTELTEAAKGEYRLDVALEKAQLGSTQRSARDRYGGGARAVAR